MSPHNTEYRTLGPELLTTKRCITMSLGNWQAKFSSISGCHVAHLKRSEHERIEQFMSMPMPEQIAKLVTSLEVSNANEAEIRVNDVVKK